MAILDIFKGKEPEEMIKLENGKKIPKKDIFITVIRLFDTTTRKWVVIPLEEGEEQQQIFEKADIDDIESYDGVHSDYDGIKADFYTKDNKRLGTYWKVKPRGGTQMGAGMNQNIGNIADYLKNQQKDIDEVKQAVLGEGEGDSEDKELGVLLKFKKKMQLYREITGETSSGEVNRDDYPMAARLMADKEVTAGFKSLLEDSVKSVGKAFFEGMSEGKTNNAESNKPIRQMITKRALPAPPRKEKKVKKEEVKVEKVEDGEVKE